MKLLPLVAAFAARGAAAENECQKLETLEFRQHTAPKTMDDHQRRFSEVVFKRLDGVEATKVRWDGHLVHHQVGSYELVVDVHMWDGEKRCYSIEMVVRDTDECDPATPADWRHACDASSTCVNSDGSYACQCPADRFAPEGSQCGGFGSSKECCDELPNPDEAASCRAAFACEPDLCQKECAPNADCARTVVDVGNGRKAARYACSCAADRVGSGKRCATPAATRNPGPRSRRRGPQPAGDGAPPCGCAEVDACAGVRCGAHESCAVSEDGAASCGCDAGFSKDGEHCVDETLPTLSINGPAVVTLDQCGPGYREEGVSITDENAEIYSRELWTRYSSREFPYVDANASGLQYKTGDYLVTYSIETPWTDPPRVETTRSVVVRDVDECRARGPCAHQCVEEATCVNDATGAGYRCVCPEGTLGDGFARETAPWKGVDDWRIPSGFENATGCADDQPPLVELHGDEVEHVMLNGVDALAELSHLHATAPGRLCHKNPDEPCATASDLVRGARQPLGLVTASTPRLVGDDLYSVTYGATDGAGNAGAAEMRVKIKRVSYHDFLAAAKGACPPQKPCPDRPPRSCPAAPPPPSDGSAAALAAALASSKERCRLLFAVCAAAAAFGIIALVIAANAHAGCLAAEAKAKRDVAAARAAAKPAATNGGGHAPRSPTVTAYPSPRPSGGRAYRSPFDSPSVVRGRPSVGSPWS